LSSKIDIARNGPIIFVDDVIMHYDQSKNP